MTPGEKIRAERDRQAISQEKLAAAAGLSYRTVATAESGARVRPATLKAIGEALGIPWDDLRPENVAS